jgi:hypothetical protein
MSVPAPIADIGCWAFMSTRPLPHLVIHQVIHHAVLWLPVSQFDKSDTNNKQSKIKQLTVSKVRAKMAP